MVVCQFDLQKQRILVKADSPFHSNFNLSCERKGLLSRLEKRADLILSLAEQPEVLTNFSLPSGDEE